MTCSHENTQFVGMYSLIGNYICQDCGAKIDPVSYHKMKGYFHNQLIDYYRTYPERLNPIDRDHPSVSDLYND